MKRTYDTGIWNGHTKQTYDTGIWNGHTKQTYDTGIWNGHTRVHDTGIYIPLVECRAERILPPTMRRGPGGCRLYTGLAVHIVYRH
jgi:hypothetical protein